MNEWWHVFLQNCVCMCVCAVVFAGNCVCTQHVAATVVAVLSCSLLTSAAVAVAGDDNDRFQLYFQDE